MEVILGMGSRKGWAFAERAEARAGVPVEGTEAGSLLCVWLCVAKTGISLAGLWGIHEGKSV